MNEELDYITYGAAARMLGFAGERTIRRMVNAGRLKKYKPVSRPLVSRKEVTRLIEQSVVDYSRRQVRR
jgi:excisionase family DNA binding protein